jgi:voltage-gated potassium channel
MTKTMDDPERERTLHDLQDWLEKPMLVLSLIWLVLLVVELVWGLTQALWITGQVIWVIFIAEFALSLALAPRKLRYVRDNWLKALSLLAPALRVLRIARLARLARAGAASKGLRLLRVVGSMNRGMKALGAAMGRRGFGYVLTLTVLVAFVGAAGMYALERDAPGGGFDSYASALWWTAMVLATMGSEYWPKTPDGRLLCLFLAVYAFTVFGYVTATLATFFIGSDARDENAGLRSELALLREELRAAREK